MSEEVEVSTDLQPAVAPESATSAPVESAETDQVQESKETQEQEKPAKTFTQDELNEIVKREKAKADAKAERRAMRAYQETLEKIALRQQPAPQAQQADDGRPKASQYETVDDYVAATVKWELDKAEKSQQQAKAAESQKSLVSKTEKLYTDAERIDGFDRDAFDDLPLTPQIAAALLEADTPAQVMAWMVNNPDEVERIAGLSPARQAIEIGKVEAKLASAPKPSNAPPPIKPTGIRGAAAPTDPSKMNMEEYKAWREKQSPTWWRGR